MSTSELPLVFVHMLPALIPPGALLGGVAVVIDVLRATTMIYGRHKHGLRHPRRLTRAICHVRVALLDRIRPRAPNRPTPRICGAGFGSSEEIAETTCGAATAWRTAPKAWVTKIRHSDRLSTIPSPTSPYRCASIAMSTDSAHTIKRITRKVKPRIFRRMRVLWYTRTSLRKQRVTSPTKTHVYFQSFYHEYSLL